MTLGYTPLPVHAQPHHSGTTPLPVQGQPHHLGTTPLPVHAQPDHSGTTPLPVHAQSHPSDATVVPMHQSMHTKYPPTIWTACNPSTLPPGPHQLWMPNLLSAPVCTAPFTLVFMSGQISICYGCRKNFTKPAVIPFNLVVKHEDNRSYTATDGCWLWSG